MGKQRKTRRFRLISRGLVLVFLVGLASALKADTGSGQRPVPELLEGFVYFRDHDHLAAVSKYFPSGLNDHDLGLALLQSLMAGPPDPGLQPLFPLDTRVNALFITPGGEAYVDLALTQFPRADTLTEYLAVYGLVNTLTLNIPAVTGVKILVNGAENSSLGGHLSLAPFFKTQMLIVK